MNTKLIKFGFFSAMGEVIYIFLVALLMLNTEDLFGKVPNVFGIISVLLLLVISASISGALVLGKPILLYLERKKPEAIKLFFITLGWLLIFLVIILIMIST